MPVISKRAAVILAVTATLAAVAATAVSANGNPRFAADSPTAIGSVVDSVLPVEESLRRFKVGLSPSAALAGPSSLDELINEFFTALQRVDTAALQNLTISRAEYAYLYYPTSIYARKPYQLSPDVAWMLFAANNKKGVARALREFGGARARIASVGCLRERSEGLNRYLEECHLELQRGTAAKVDLRLFGSVIVMDGHYKLLSMGGDL